MALRARRVPSSAIRTNGVAALWGFENGTTALLGRGLAQTEAVVAGGFIGRKGGLERTVPGIGPAGSRWYGAGPKSSRTGTSAGPAGAPAAPATRHHPSSEPPTHMSTKPQAPRDLPEPGRAGTTSSATSAPSTPPTAPSPASRTSARSSCSTRRTSCAWSSVAQALHLGFFRNEGHYFEQVTNQILDDLVKAVKPRAA